MRSLAIFTPQVGVPSETFIQRHIEEVAPGHTVTVSGEPRNPKITAWSIDCPHLRLDRVASRNMRGFSERLYSKVTGTPLSINPTKAFLRRHNVQVIMGEYLHWSLSWLPIANKMSIPFFAHAHGYDVSSYLRDDEWRTRYLQYNDSAGIITVSQVSRNRLIELGIRSDQIHVVPCGVDIPDIPPQRTHRNIVRCVAVGRLVDKKAPLLMLNAFRLASQECPTLQLDVVGDGPLRLATEQFVSAFNLGERVRIHGVQPHNIVLDLLGKADIFLQHSITDPRNGDEEGLPVAILEAMANALPVVSTRHAGIPEAVIPTTGLLSAEGNSNEMATHIITLAQNPELRDQLGYAAWERAAEHFSAKRECSDLRRILGFTI